MSRRERVEKTCRLSEVIIHITNIMHLRVGAEIIGVIAIFTADIEPHLDADTDPLHRGGIDIIPYQCPGIVRGPGKNRVGAPLTVKQFRLRARNLPRVIQYRPCGIAPGIDQDLFRQVGHRDIAIVGSRAGRPAIDGTQCQYEQ